MFRAARLALSLCLVTGAVQAATVHVEDDRAIPRYSCSSYSYYCSAPDPILLDMDGDGTDDVWMRGYSYSGRDSSSANLTIQGQNGTQIEAGPKHNVGDVIDASLVFSDSVQPATYRYRRSRWGSSTRTYAGTWGDGTSALRQGFIGIALAGGNYGWLELEIYGNGTGRLLAWGYEMESGLGIAAGAEQTYVAPPPASSVPLPATGVLLAGALGLLGLRRRKG